MPSLKSKGSLGDRFLHSGMLAFRDNVESFKVYGTEYLKYRQCNQVLGTVSVVAEVLALRSFEET